MKICGKNQPKSSFGGLKSTFQGGLHFILDKGHLVWDIFSVDLHVAGEEDDEIEV